MKKNVILSTVAATVVTGVLMLSGCGETSTGPESSAQSPGHTAEGSINITAPNSASVKVVATESNGGTQGGGQQQVTAVVKKVRCADSTGAATEAECNTKCTTANPCGVKIESACSLDANAANATSALDFSKLSDIIGAWHQFNNTANADVVAAKAEKPLYSGVSTVTGFGGISSCDFAFSSFIVCALDKNGDRYFVNSENSAGYAMVLLEYGDGSTAWIKAPITFKSNGTEPGQPFINIDGLSGAMPAKVTVFPVLKDSAVAHSTGSTGTGSTGGAGDA